MRIAYILPDVAISGGVAVVLQHANRLAARGHEVVIGCTGRAGKAEWFPHQAVPVVPHNRLPEGLDLLIATSWPTVFDAVSMPARRKCYFVQADESGFYRRGTPLFHAALLSYRVDCHFLTMADWLARWLKESFGKDAVVIPNGIDPDVFHPPLGRRQPGTGRLRVLIEGAFAIPAKGMKEAFEAVAGLDCEVWCVSSYGKPYPGLRYDRFFERVPAEGMREIYSDCDILLKLSKSESFGLPPLEMMACGGACVVSRIAGHEEYARDGENALVVAPEDIAGARSALLRLIEDKDLRERLRAGGLKTAAERGWGPAIDRLERCLGEIASSNEEDDPAAAQVNRSLVLAYEGILSASLFKGGLQTIAHRLRRKTGSGLLTRLGEAAYLHVKNHRGFYGRIFGDSL